MFFHVPKLQKETKHFHRKKDAKNRSIHVNVCIKNLMKFCNAELGWLVRNW